MIQTNVLPTIIVCDDSPSDRKLVIMAFQKAMIRNPILEIGDGEELMDYLLRQGRHKDRNLSHNPHVILLDLNMPRKNGLEVLSEIKSNPKLQSIPIIMLTTSKADEDVIRSYKLGVNSFVTKPVHLEEFMEAIRKLGQFWLELVALPDEPRT